MLLAFLAAFAHAGWNLLAKQAAPLGKPFVWSTNLVGLLALLPLAIAVSVQEPPLSWGMVAWACVGGILHGLYALCLQRGYRFGDVSVVYPLSRGISPVIVTLVGIFLLHQQPSGFQIVGIVTSGLAVCLMAVFGAERNRDGAPGAFGAIVWSLLIAIIIAAYTLWDAFAVVKLEYPILPYYSALALLQVVSISLVNIGSFGVGIRSFREHWALGLGIACLIPASYLLGLFANHYITAGSVAAIRGTSVVIVAVAATVLYREKRRIGFLVLIPVLTIGIVLIAF